MQLTRWACDMCLSEFSKPDKLVRLTISDYYGEAATLRMDLCSDCYDKLKTWLKTCREQKS